MTYQTLDTATIEARARALRAAYVREAFAALVARLKSEPKTADATA